MSENKLTFKDRFNYPNNKQRRDNYYLLRSNSFNVVIARRVRDFKENHLFIFILYNVLVLNSS